MSHRLFVASCPPRDIRESLLAAMGGVASARWQDDDQLHLTLRFIGEVDSRTANDVVEALSFVQSNVIETRIAGVGLFKSKHGNALWAGLEARDALTRLHKKIDRALVIAGMEPERRAYRPHITLARLSKQHGDLASWLTQNGHLSSMSFKIDSFGLYESAITDEGARYDLIESWSLRPNPI